MRTDAIAVVAGRRLGTYDARAHATFTLMRYVDDIAFHTDVRSPLNADLSIVNLEPARHLSTIRVINSGGPSSTKMSPNYMFCDTSSRSSATILVANVGRLGVEIDRDDDP